MSKFSGLIHVISIVLLAGCIAAPSMSSEGECPVNSNDIRLKITQTLDTVYLRSNKDFKLHTSNGPAHSWIKHPLADLDDFDDLAEFDELYYSAIWLGQGVHDRIFGCGTAQSIRPRTAQKFPVGYDVMIADNDSIEQKIDAINNSEGKILLLLLPGLYRTGNLKIEQDNVAVLGIGPVVFNGEWQENLTFEKQGDTDVYRNISDLSELLPQLDQVHVELDSKTERLSNFQQSGVAEDVQPWSSIRAWNIESLNESATGGWFVVNDELFVKMPNGSNPTGKLHITGEKSHAIEFTGDNIWVQGLTIEHYGRDLEFGTPTSALRYRTFSGFKFTGSHIVVRYNQFRFNRSHALVFQDSTDILTERNSFVDNQNYMSYQQVRADGPVCIGDPLTQCVAGSAADHVRAWTGHRHSNRVLYLRSSVITHRHNRHAFNLQAVTLSGVRYADIISNRLSRTRNVPIEIYDGIRLDSNQWTFGHSITVAKNTYTDVGWSIPSNERNANTGPVWWINNCVDEYGWPGNTAFEGTSGGVQANRYGGGITYADGRAIFEPDYEPLGVQRVYNNIIASSQTHDSFDHYHGWVMPGNKRFFPGSAFLNNVWQVADPNPGEKDAAAWAANSSNGATGAGPLLTFDDLTWDFNQFWMTSALPNAFTASVKWTRDIKRNQLGGDGFEPNGHFQDPMIKNCIVTNPIPLTTIEGVSGNRFLFSP